MDGVLALGHFCESHGPCIMLCTQSVKEEKPIQFQSAHNLTVPWCNACKSIEVDNAFVSYDQAKHSYITTRTPLRQDMAFLLKQACVRSLSCEEETGKEGGAVYFGDSERGHVLSYTFRLPDSLARGFHRLFTVIILMRDRIHLLNSWPFITTHVRELIDYLKKNACTVNAAEQSERSQRVHRLATGTPVGSPRSLVELTGVPNVFAQVHLWFTWLLTAGTKTIVEQTNTSFPTLSPCLGHETIEGFTLVQLTKSGPTMSIDNELTTTMQIRNLYHLMNGNQFRILCYCILHGMQVVVRGEKDCVSSILNVLMKFVPKNWCKTHYYTSEYIGPEECNFLGLSLKTAVPQSNSSIVRLDVVNGDCHLKWTGSLPEKLPTLLVKLLRTIEDERIQNEVVETQIQVFIEEWSNTAQTLYWVKENNSEDKMSNLMQSLGVQPCDSTLIKYWIKQIGMYPKSIHLEL